MTRSYADGVRAARAMVDDAVMLAEASESPDEARHLRGLAARIGELANRVEEPSPED